MTDQHLIASSVWTGEPDKGHVYHLSDISEADRIRQYGVAEIDIPAPITAGTAVDVKFRFTVAEADLSVGSALRVAWRWPFDWSDLQQTDPSGQNHLTVSTPNHVTIETRYERRGSLNPWHHDIDLRITSGTLKAGDLVEITCSQWDAPTFATIDGYFLMLINLNGDNRWIRLVDPARFNIVPAKPDRLIAIAPADGIIGEQSTVRVRAVDIWENATAIEPPYLTCSDADVGEPQLCERYPVWEYPVKWNAIGVHRMQAAAGRLTCTTNPTRVTETAPQFRTYWGDLHAGQSEIGCGAGSLDHHYAYARDVAALQFTSQQANDHYMTRELWEHVRSVTPRHNVEGEFLAFLGCEWSPYTENGGDRNVIYLTDESRMRRSDRFFKEHDPDPESDLRRAPEFLDVFRKEKVLLNLHVGGRPTNLDWHAPEIEPLFEVHSTHATSEWFLFDAIRRGYKVGVTAGTDGVMGRPGACGPGRRITRNVHNGLTAVSAESLTQRSVADAFLQRKCYGTTGARILLDVSVNGQTMGSVIKGEEAPKISVRCEGTVSIERIDLYRDVDLIASEQIAVPDPNRLRLLWGGAREEGTAAAQRQIWDGTLRAESGEITDIEPVGLQCPLDVIERKGPVISWSSSTAGNDMGFTFSTHADETSFLHVTTEPCSFSRSLEEVRRKSVVVDAGGIARRIELGPAPARDSPMSAGFEFTDPDPQPGEHAYWVRITQTDRHRAWSSPIYVTLT